VKPLHLVLIVLALAAGFALRAPGVFVLELCQWDEGPYIGYALERGPGFREDPWIVYAPPLYPALIAAAHSLGLAPIDAGYCVALLFGVLSLVAAAWLAAEAFGKSAAPVAALLLALEPFHVLHSRLALTETTFTTLLLAATALAIRALRRGSSGAAILCGLVSGLAMTTKFHGFLPLAVLGIFALRPFQPRLVLFAALGALPPLGALAVAIHDTIGFEAFLASRQTWVNGLHPWTLRATVEFFAETTYRFGSLPIVGLAIVGAVLPRRKSAVESDARLPLLVAIALLFVVLCAYRNYVRLFVPFVALLVPLAARGVVALVERTPLRGAARTTAAAAATLGLASLAWPNLDEARAERSTPTYLLMANLLAAKLEQAGNEALSLDEPPLALAICQQTLFPHLDAAATGRTYSVTEPTGIERFAAGEVQFVVTDQDPLRHAKVAQQWPARAGDYMLDLVVPNPLPPAVMFDRLGRERYRRYVDDPGADEFAAETTLRLYRLRGH
jgi:4-amino-4-deoxy-L-arabinose transferase-like glycosyltransferase